MKVFIYKICTVFLIFNFIFLPFSLSDDIDYDTTDINKDIIESSSTPVSTTSSIKIPETNSRASVIIDRNTNTILYGKNENQKRKMASTTKIMTATIIIENCNLNDTLEVSKKAAGTGGSRLGLKSGDKITVKDLLYGLMMRSGNDAAVALAEYCRSEVLKVLQKK